MKQLICAYSVKTCLLEQLNYLERQTLHLQVEILTAARIHSDFNSLLQLQRDWLGSLKKVVTFKKYI